MRESEAIEGRLAGTAVTIDAATAKTEGGESAAGLARLYRRVTLRIIPLLILLYFTAFLDRVNVSFASLSMNRDLGIGDDVFGLAAGVFFVGYLLFSLPSNMLLNRFGARRWIAVLMVTWGVFSCGMAFVHTAGAYVWLRFLIGAAEAGFFPGVILYLTLWLPPSVRAGLMALFTLSIPLSNVVGAPVSAAILALGGMRGLAGWQWLFLLEGLPAVLLGCAVPFLLASGPEDVSWLGAAEGQALAAAIRHEEGLIETTGERASWRQVSARLARPGAIYFCLMVGLYGISFWIPKILHDRGVLLAELGWKTAIPFALGGLGMVAWSRASDKRGERQRSLAATFALAGVGFVVVGLSTGWVMAVVGFSAVSVGVLAGMPIFWAWLSGSGLSGGAGPDRAFAIAAVNSVGNLGGFLGPYATGKLMAQTHTPRLGLLLTAMCLLCGAALVVSGRGVRSRSLR